MANPTHQATNMDITTNGLSRTSSSGFAHQSSTSSHHSLALAQQNIEVPHQGYSASAYDTNI